MYNARLRIDFERLTEAALGPEGISERELHEMAGLAAAALAQTGGLRAAGKVGFFDLPDDQALARRAMDFARELPAEVDTMVVLGIGGSSLGPHALYSALGRPYDAARPRSPGMPRRLFFPDNADPVTFAAILDSCAPERTVWAVVTKSGGTAETAAQMLVLLDRLERALGADRMRRHVIAITDPAKGALRAVAGQLGLTTFPVPPSVGGRFAVLSAVGLVPAAVAGLDVTGLLEGARSMRDRVLGAGELRDNPALLLATLLHLQHVQRRRPMVVMMPYADALYDTADWFRQLWAESLGKEVDITGKRVNVGPTPIAARGATDQHSQLQLYAEGPADKSFLFVGVEERGTEIRIPAGRFADMAELGYLDGHGLGELLDAEMRGTIASLTRRGRPSATIMLERVDAQALGELMMLLMATTAFAGPIYGVDPFDQPGVEEAKRLAYAALGRPGYENLRELLDV